MPPKKITSSTIGLIYLSEKEKSCRLRVTWTVERGLSNKESVFHVYLCDKVHIPPSDQYKVVGLGYTLENAFPVKKDEALTMEILNRLPTHEEVEQSITQLSSMETI